MQRPGLGLNRVLQGLQQGYVFGNVVVLMSNPPGNAGSFAVRTFDDHPNARRSRISMGPAVNVRYEVRHSSPDLTKMLENEGFVKKQMRFPLNAATQAQHFCEKNVN
jgi:hypothetical protein